MSLILGEYRGEVAFGVCAPAGAGKLLGGAFLLQEEAHDSCIYHEPLAILIGLYPDFLGQAFEPGILMGVHLRCHLDLLARLSF